MRPQVFIAHSALDGEWLERLKTLLVSPAFLASEFVREDELATALAAARQAHGLQVFWVPVRPCMWRQTALAAYQAVHDAAKPLSTLAEPEADAALLALCQHIHAAVAATPAPSGSPRSSTPYRGLSAFQIDDAPLFFGREVLTEKLWLRFKALYSAPDATRLLAVLGPSGSGKSSVARAGLLAALASRPVPGPQAVRRIALKPGEHPLRALALALKQPSVVPSAAPDLAAQRKLMDDLGQPNKRGEFDGLTLWAANLPDATTSPLVLLVDQFEEVYTACREPSQRDAFVSLLLHAAGDRARHVAVVMTLRSDFLGETHRQHPELNRLIAEQAVLVPAMSQDELRRAIAEPALRAGMPIDEARVELLLTEARGSEGALPLLEFALTRIWEGLLAGKPAGATLRDIGGIGGALASTAKGIYSALSESEQVIARRALVRLVQLGEGTRDTRRRASLGQLCGRGDREADVLAVLRQFAADNARMVTLSGRSGETVAEVTHEALFDHWTELRAWIDEGRADRRFHDRVAESARLWNEDRSRSGRLWRPPDLDLLRAFRARRVEDLSPLDEAFFIAAEQAQEADLAEKRQRARFLRLGLALVSTLLVITIGIAGYAVKQQRTAAHERDHAEQRELDMVIEQGRQLLLGKEARPLEALVRLQYARARGSRAPMLSHLLAEAARPFDGLRLSLREHSSEVTMASYSPDGRRIATSNLNQLRIWDAENGRLMLTPICLMTNFTSVAYSPNGRRIVTGGKDGTAQVWDAQSGELLSTLHGHFSPVTSASYSPDGRCIVTSSEDQTARVWDAQERRVLTTLQGHSSFVSSASYSPDGRCIVTSSGDKTARIWDAQSGRLLLSMQGHSAPVTSASYSPDGRYVVTGSRDQTARVWDVQSGQLLHTLQGHSSSIHSVSYSPDGHRIVTSSGDHTARVWDAKSGQLLDTLQGHSSSVHSASYSPDGRWIVTSGTNHTVQVWDTKRTQLLTVLQGHGSSITSVNYSPDGRRIITGSVDQTVRVWDAQSGRLQATFLGQATAINSVSHSPDGSSIVISSAEQNPQVWSAQTGQLRTTLVGHSSGITSASYSPDGRRIVTSSLDQTARVWDARSGALVSTWRGHSSGVTSASYSPDGSHIVTASWDQTAQVWCPGPA
jgi:WD40 repeat protein